MTLDKQNIFFGSIPELNLPLTNKVRSQRVLSIKNYVNLFLIYSLHFAELLMQEVFVENIQVLFWIHSVENMETPQRS